MIYEIVWLEDDKDLMDSTENLFISNNINIFKCRTSAQALKQIIEGGCTNLLLDLEFPNSKRDGLEFLNQILKIKKDLNVVILTGESNMKEAIRLIKQRIVLDYLEKPIPLDASGQEIFFYTLKKYFKPSTGSKEKENTKKQLKIWRNKTWINICIVLGISIVLFIALLWNNQWSIENVSLIIKSNLILTWVLGLGWVLINTFLIQNLNSKYNNYSNINNYLKSKEDESN